jgi:hypothetical protein
MRSHAVDGTAGIGFFPNQGYDYFASFQPIAKAGYSIFIYHISLPEANEVRRQMGLELLGGLAEDGKKTVTPAPQ